MEAQNPVCGAPSIGSPHLSASGYGDRIRCCSNPLIRIRYLLTGILVLCGLASITSQVLQAQTETVLYSFTCQSDGCAPQSGVVLDQAGNIYGATFGGGSGSGAVYKLTASGTFSNLYAFTGQQGDGFNPGYSTLVMDSAGNLYGTTYAGGAYGVGTVFKVTPSGTESVVYNFSYPNGSFPRAGVIRDASGNLYGTTFQGGANGGGTVFKVTPTGTETVLYGFTSPASPQTGVVRDSKGNLYGTTNGGGAFNFGLVYKVSASGAETTLHSFAANGKDGFGPNAVILSGSNLYGTTQNGGNIGAGAIFKSSTSGTETVIHNFGGAVDGFVPNAGVIRDSKGNLYGTTVYGGAYDLGAVFKVGSSGALTLLHSFSSNGTDGYFPRAGLAIDKSGNLYGTTLQGGTDNAGTIFKIVP